MKAADALKWAGIAFAGVAAYVIVTRAAKAGGDAVAAVKEAVTVDLNPASPENVIYRNIPDSVKSAVFDWFDSFAQDEPESIAPPKPTEPVQLTLDKKLTDQTGKGLKVDYGQGLDLAARMNETGGSGLLTDYERRSIRLMDAGEPPKAPNPFDFTRIPNIVRDIFN